MRIIGLLVWTLVSAPNPVSAQLSLPSFDRIRSMVGGSQGTFAPVEYRYEANARFPDPDTNPPPNLSEAQLRDLDARLLAEENRLRPGARARVLGQAQRQRIQTRLRQMDRWYLDAVPADRWGEIIDGIVAVAAAELAAGRVDGEAVADAALKSAATALRDPLTTYMTPAEKKAADERQAKVYYGIGATLDKTPAGARITLVFPNSPAERAGLREGDVITSVDGVSAAGKELEEVILRIKGVNGTAVNLAVDRAGTQLTASPVRGAVARANVYGRMVTADVGYIHMESFRDDSDRLVFAEIARLKRLGMTKLVLDLRGNLGGRVDAAASLTSEFLRDGQEIVSYRQRGQMKGRHVTVGNGDYLDLPLAVLVDGNSASASELFGGALQDHTAAPIIVGSQSYGKGTRQYTFDVDNGRALRITDARWHTPDGTSIDAQRNPDGSRRHGTGGLTPDVSVAVTPEQAAAIFAERGRELNGGQVTQRTADPQLDRAVELLNGPPA